MTEHEIAYLRDAITVAWSARRHGNQPFGAILVDASGQVLHDRDWPGAGGGGAGGPPRVLALRMPGLARRV